MIRRHALALTALVAIGCADSETTAADVVKKTKQAAATAGEFVTQQVAAYRQAMSEKLDELQPQLQALQARAKQLAAQGKTQLASQVEQLEARRVALAERIKAASAESGEAWADVKRGLDEAWQELETAFAQAAERFKNEPVEAPAASDVVEPPAETPVPVEQDG